MRLAVSHYSFFRDWRDGSLDAAAFVRRASDLDVDGVELLAPLMRDDREFEAARDALAETGLPCPIFSVSNNLALPDPEAREAERQKVLTGIERARTLGADVVRVFAGNLAQGVTLEDATGWIVDGLRSAAVQAEAAGVRLALENHGLLAGRADQVTHLIEAVGSPALRANPDFGNFLLVDADPVASVRSLAPYAAMGHLKDFAPAPEGHEGFAFESLGARRFLGTVLGEGSIDLAACQQAMADAGFFGWLSLEYEGEESAATAVPRGLAFARRLLASR